MIKNKIILTGSIILVAVFLIGAYSLFQVFGITNAPIKINEITIKTESAEKIYDGKPISNFKWTISSGQLHDGDTIEVYMDKEITDVGYVFNEAFVTIYNAEGQNITNQYKITFDLGELVVHKRSITFSTGSSEKTYDGTPLTNTEWQIVEGTFLDEHTPIVNFVTSEAAPGAYLNEILVQVVDEDNVDVTKNYDIKTRMGSLNIHKRQLYITTESAEKLYDGMPLKHEVWNILYGEVLESHVMSTLMMNELIEPGIIANDIEITIYDSNNNLVTSYYDIVFGLGQLKIEKPQVVILTGTSEKLYDGKPLKNETYEILYGNIYEGHELNIVFPKSITNPGYIENEPVIQILNENSIDISKYYDLTIQKGVLTILKKEITIKTFTDIKTYDGTPLMNQEWIISEGGLLEGHTIEVDMYSQITNVGTINNDFKVVIFNELHEEITMGYIIDRDLGYLEVRPRYLTITTEGEEKAYDALPLSNDEWTISYGELVSTHTLNVTLGSSITEPGQIRNTIKNYTIYDESGVEVTSNYLISKDEGLLVVNKIDVTVYTYRAEKEYDGTPLDTYEYFVDETAILDIHHYVVERITIFSNIDVRDAKIKVTFLDEENKNVGKYYNVIEQFEKVSITKRKLTIKTADDKKVYNGLELKNEGYQIISGSILEGHKIEVIGSTAIVYVGKQANVLNFRLINEETQSSVDSYYDINYEYGTLEITKKQLIFTASSVTKEYDGLPIEPQDVHYDLHAIPSGHEVEIENIQTFSEIDTRDYIRTIKIWKDGLDASSNFDIRINKETLKIEPRKITILTETFTHVYNGMIQNIGTPLDKNGKLLEGHYFNFESLISPIDVGVYTNTMDVQIYSNNGDVSSYYNVTMETGKITIQKREIKVTLSRVTEEYNGLSISGGMPQVMEGSLVGEHRFVKIHSEEKTIPGVHEVAFEVAIYSDAIEVTHNYSITYVRGILEITKRYIVVETNDFMKVYDGLPINVGNPMDIYHKLLPGHSLSIANSKTTIIPGVYENEMTVVILSGGVNVTQYYDIDYIFGDLTIEKRPITITTNFMEKEYDGLPIETGIPIDLYNWLVNGHEIHVASSTVAVDAGTFKNEMIVTIWANGENVSRFYDIEYIYEDLKIHKRSIIIKTFNGEKVYDGTPLTEHRYEIISGEFVFGHEPHVIVTSELTEVGQIDNEIGGYYVIDTATMRHVTMNYDFVMVHGKLVVLPIPYSGNDLSTGYNDFPKEDVLKVKSTIDDTVYLRQESFGSYRKNGFDAARVYTGYTPINPMEFLTEALRDANITFNQIEIKHTALQYGPVIPFSASDIPGTNDIIVSNLNREYEYNYVSYNYIKTPNLSIQNPQIKPYEEQYRNFVYQEYLSIPQDTKNRLLEIAAANNILRQSPSIVADIKNYIQNAADYNLKHDNFPSDVDMVIYFLDVLKEGICQHFAAAATMMYRAFGIPARYVTGIVAETKANQWVTVNTETAHAWTEIYIDGLGWVVIEATAGGANGNGSINGPGGSNPVDGENPEFPDNKPVIQIRPIPVRALYNGTGTQVLRPTNVTVHGFNEYEEQGYTYTFTLDGELSELGIASSRVLTFDIFDPQGNKVTNNFNCQYLDGELQLYTTVLTIKTSSFSKVYDGKPLTSSGYEIIGGTLLEGHREIVTNTGNITNVGHGKNTATTVILDENDNNVTGQYYIIYEYGDLVVTQRVITVISASNSKPYDGTALYDYEFELEGELVEGHEIEVVITGSITRIGRTDNVVEEVLIKDENGVDVEKNYTVIIVTGILIITR